MRLSVGAIVSSVAVCVACMVITVAVSLERKLRMSRYLGLRTLVKVVAGWILGC
jgi:hypothetical protein